VGNQGSAFSGDNSPVAGGAEGKAGKRQGAEIEARDCGVVRQGAFNWNRAWPDATS
jgi:hypothetical protein